MILLNFFQSQNPFLFIRFFNLLEEGGFFFMLPVFILLLLVFFLIVKGILALKNRSSELQKHIKLLNSIGLLAVVWGMLGQLIGLVGMFDQMESISNISPSTFAGGIKVSALPPIFGFLVFVISRVASIVFTWIQREEDQK